MGTVIDTSVIVQGERASALLPLPTDEPFALSAITVSELLHGVHRAATAEQKARREAYVARVLDAVPVAAFDEPVARVHARVWAELSAVGNVPAPHDLIIAATALARGWAVATANPRGFTRVPGLTVHVAAPRT